MSNAEKIMQDGFKPSNGGFLGGGVYGASVSEAEPAPPPLPVLPVPDETDRWSDVASSDEEGDVDDTVHK